MFSLVKISQGHMMNLITVRVEDNDEMVVNCDFVKDIEYGYESSINTLILGENGVGKSFVLRLITDIFMNLEKVKSNSRKPKFKYEKYYIKYNIRGDLYEVERISSREILAKCNNRDIDYKEIQLPKTLLAVSFIVNDKFFSTKDTNTIYRYMGVRSSSNSTYTSSILRKVYKNLLQCLALGRQKELHKILEMIGLGGEYFKIKRYSNEDLKYYISEEGKRELVQDVSHEVSDLVLVKQGNEISFELCSSGEKHILFAFSGILAQLKDESIVLIDEPEISLHPEWQIKYLSKIEEIFSEMEGCHFILASHSHFFVSDLLPNKSSVVVFKNDSNQKSNTKVRFCSELLPYDTCAWSAENIIYNVFGLRTTRNYYFEQDLRDLIDIMSDERMEGKTRTEHMLPYIKKLKKYVLSDNDPLHKLIKEAEVIANV